jgi:RNA polymerase sigma-70 factor (ECF subfamily)
MLVNVPGTFESFQREPQKALLAQCVTGEVASWRELHRRYYPTALDFVRKLGILGDHGEDVCQNVFLQVHRHLASFRGDSDIVTWLYRICISEARRFRRKERLAKLASTLFGDALASEPSVGLEWSQHRAVQQVERALSQLSPRRREILVLFDFEGLSGEQVAEIVGCSLASVWRERHYAYRQFVAAVDPQLGQEAS